MLEIQRARPGPPTGIGTGTLHLGTARHVGLSHPSLHAVPYTLATMMLVCDAAGVPSRQESDVLRASRHDGRLFELRRRDRLPAAGAATSRLQPCSALARVAPAAELTLCQRYTALTSLPPAACRTRPRQAPGGHRAHLQAAGEGGELAHRRADIAALTAASSTRLHMRWRRGRLPLPAPRGPGGLFVVAWWVEANNEKSPKARGPP